MTKGCLLDLRRQQVDSRLQLEDLLVAEAAIVTATIVAVKPSAIGTARGPLDCSS